MRVARIIEVDDFMRGKRWIVINEKSWELMDQEQPPKMNGKCYHMSLEAAKDKAYKDGYRYYISGTRLVKFREIRDRVKMRSGLL